jgi:O-antigen/teichoic acid export membrane protein
MKATHGADARRVASNTVLQVGAEVIGRFASLGLYVILARDLGAVQFGVFSYGLAIAVLGVGFAAFGLDYVVTRDVARDRNQASALLWNPVAAKVACGLVGTLVVTGMTLSDAGRHDATAVALLCLSALTDLVAKSFHAVLRGFETVRSVAAGFVAQRLITAGAAVAVLALGKGLEAVCIVCLAASLVGLALPAGTLLRHHPACRKPAVRAEAANRLLIASLPLGISTLFGAFLARADMAMLSSIRGTAEVGMYAAAYRPFESTFFVCWAFGLAALPYFSRLGRDSEPSIGLAWTMVGKIVLLVLCFASVTMAALAPRIVTALYGPAYGQSAAVLELLAPGIACYGIYTVAAYLLISQNRARAVACVSGIAVAVNVMLNLALIPHHGAAGAALAMTIAQLFLAALACAVVLRDLGNISLARVFSGAVACSAAAGLLALTFGRPGAVAGALIFPLGVLAWEAVVYPADLRAALNLVRNRGLRLVVTS